ncbi:MAG: hypothetical protein RLZ45_330, partial [Verrucomicrobiota bacterium]
DHLQWQTNHPGPGVRSYTQPSGPRNGTGSVWMRVEFSQPVLVGRMPVIPFLFGGEPRFLVYRTGAGTSILEFEYRPTDADAAGAVPQLDPVMGQIIRLTGGAAITDMSGNLVQSIVDGADRLVVLGSLFRHQRSITAEELDQVLDINNPSELGGFLFDFASKTPYYQNPAKPYFTNYTLPTFRPAANGVEVYKVYYNSSIPSLGGKPALASGLLAFPNTGAARMDLVSYQHGTVFSKQVVPSRCFDTPNPQSSDYYWTYESRLVVAALGGQGSVVISSDYFGLGDSTEPHAFTPKSPHQQVCLDLLLAADGFLEARGIERGGLYLSGWSLGGLVSMQFLEKLESLGRKVDGTATAATTAPVLIGVQRLLFNPRYGSGSETPDFNLNFFPILATFAYEYYYDRPGFARSVIDPRYYDIARRIYEWNGDVNGVLELFGQIPPGQASKETDILQMLRPEYRNPSYFSGSELAGFFRLVAAYDFMAQSPTRTWMGGQDEAVPPSVTAIPPQVQNIWRPGSSTSIEVPGGSHRGTFVKAVADQVDWFRSISNNP